MNTSHALLPSRRPHLQTPHHQTPSHWRLENQHGDSGGCIQPIALILVLEKDNLYFQYVENNYPKTQNQRLWMYKHHWIPTGKSNHSRSSILWSAVSSLFWAFKNNFESILNLGGKKLDQKENKALKWTADGTHIVECIKWLCVFLCVCVSGGEGRGFRGGRI